MHSILRRAALCAALAAAPAATAQSSRASVHPATPPSVLAARRTSPVTLDGRLDDAAWAAATPITGFRQTQPTEGAPATQRTEVRILYDDDAIYVGARMYDSLGAAGVRGPLARRDQLLDGRSQVTTDKIAIVLDPYHNHIDRACFEVNPAGVRGDQFDGDDSFDPIWEAVARVDSLGWTAEMRIPLSQLRFNADSLQTWGLQVYRSVDRLNEQDMWSFWRRNEAGGPPFFGHLTGLALAHQARQTELVPYVVSRAQYKYADPLDPFHRSGTRDVRLGADAKLLLTSSLTLDATINPDFGQVEVDPATVNLSAFETFYDEKRPFFVSGRSAFDYGDFNCMFCDNVSNLGLFYSRRIGRAPQLNGVVESQAVYDDLPENTRILGAAKVTGRASDYTVGLLDAVTGRETARYRVDDGSDRLLERSQAVEPLTNYFVGRVRRDFREGATSVGMIATSTERRLDDSLMALRLRNRASVVGVDLAHAWSRRDYSLLAQFAVSDVGGSDSAIARTQRSSTHYFQRPDRRETTDGLFDIRYDSSRTSLRGYGLYARLGKDNGDWLWETATNWRSPGFEVNDLAFLHRADYKWLLANVSRQWTTPMGPFRNLSVVGGAQRQYNYDGDVNDEEEHYGAFGQWRNFWSTNLIYIHHPSTLDETLTRGGPMEVRSGYDYGSLGVNTDQRRTTVLGLRADVGHGISSGTRTVRLRSSIGVKPRSNVFVSFAPNVITDETAAQYVLTVADPAVAPVFAGQRYVFGYLKQRVVSLDTRVNVTFTPELTLELFAQPFIASGAYDRYREFVGARTLETRDYAPGSEIRYDAGTAQYTVDPDGAGPAAAFSFGNPDFTVRSLRGNAVLRWQYRQGSTVYLVWTQERNGFDPAGQLDLRAQSGALFRDRPVNIFLVKVSYWLGR